LADAVSGVERIGAHEVAPPPIAPTGGRQTFIKGVTREMIAVFDLQALAREPRIVVNDEVVR
jgi:chemotaxis signal transduction protein